MIARAAFALAAFAGALSGCTPPPALDLFNASGQQVALDTCKGQRVTIAAGSAARIYWRDLGCYRKGGFAIATERGAPWRYVQMPGLEKGMDRQDREALYEALHYGNQMQAWIDSDGAIHLGARDTPARQPRGYPLKPTGTE